MGTRDRYFQFPLCALHVAPSEGYQNSWFSAFKNRLDMMVGYGTVRYGQRAIEKIMEATASQYDDVIEQYEDIIEGRIPNHELDSDEENYIREQGADIRLVYAAKYGLHYMKVRGYVPSIIEGWNAVKAHAEKYKETHGSGPMHVRIRKDIMFNTKDSRKLSEREFAVLCGIYASIGRSKFSRIRIKDIIHLSAGFNSPRDLEAYNADGSNPIKPLTTKQVRKTVDDLTALGFFARASTNNATYYSNKLSEAELRDAIINAKTWKRKKLQTEKQADKIMQQAIRDIRALIKEEFPEEEQKEEQKAPF